MANSKEPLQFGVLLFTGFEVLDVYGPVEVWNTLAHIRERFGEVSPSGAKYPPITVNTITRDGKAVHPGPRAPDPCGALSSGNQWFNATHSFEDCPKLDVLLIPGGLGAGPKLPPCEQEDGQVVTRIADVQPEVAFIRKIYPSLQYLITVCTGAGLAARAGILDGHKATTNKSRWSVTTELSSKTHWIARARWVESGNIWTTSGVSAGIDGTIAWLAKVYGKDMAKKVLTVMEYTAEENPSNDPFADMHGAEDVLPQT